VSTYKYPVRLLSTAEQDLQSLLSYVAADNVTAALSLTDRIERKLTALGTHPRLGRIPNDEQLAKLDYRFVVVDNYLIFYKILVKSVLVYRIIHGARDVPVLLMDLGQN